ncbi:unnamed protein product [Acanthoscelides obtectus]|uniref:BTB domain-containing protein n=1 Tax=Acanthoscelides obtectus TaxID=200917 RepID=A0A9P0JVJ8_ACAOB|nr:unnamed protein product [Acanthoscelides obtectus]CAK1667259.1 Protein bric-a-brac 2 [Acanthoscelides obtectus]
MAEQPAVMQHTTSSPQQFCLRWNNYQSNLTNVFDQLLQSESFVDVTLACDGHSVKAHKMVLSACSPYFQSLFFENPCQHPIVIMRDIKWPELKAAVEFMYKGEINVSQEQIGPLLKVAESLKIRGLADVNGEQDVVAPSGDLTARPSSASKAASTPTPREWGERPGGGGGGGDTEDSGRAKKRRRVSGERGSGSSAASSPCGAGGGVAIDGAGPGVGVGVDGHPDAASSAPATPQQPTTPQAQAEQPLQLTLQPVQPAQQQNQQQQQQQNHHQQQQQQQAIVAAAHQQMAHSSSSAATIAAAAAAAVAQAANTADDLEIKPGIAEMIREEERVSRTSQLAF